MARYGDEIYVDGPDGPVHLIEMPRFPPAPEAEEEAGSLAAPMPGSIVRVEVSEGDPVREGQVLVVMEAMKMEHSLRAPHDGTVGQVRAAPGDQVAAGQVLVVVTQE